MKPGQRNLEAKAHKFIRYRGSRLHLCSVYSVGMKRAARDLRYRSCALIWPFYSYRSEATSLNLCAEASFSIVPSLPLAFEMLYNTAHETRLVIIQKAKDIYLLGLRGRHRTESNTSKKLHGT
jgi:hypothetical protein